MAITNTSKSKEFIAGSSPIILKGDYRPKIASAPDPMDERNNALENLANQYFNKSLKDLSPKEIELLEEALDEITKKNAPSMMMAADGGRAQYGLGSLVKSIGKAVKKVAKSPIGKAALLAAGGSFALGLGPFASGSTMFGGKLAGLTGSGFLKSAGVKNFFLKEGAKKFALSNLSGKGIASIIGGASLLPLLMGPKEEDEFDIESYYAANRLNPNAALNPRIAGSQFAFADGGRIGYSDGMEAGAMSEKEMKKLAKSPLYKGFKTMFVVCV